MELLCILMWQPNLIKQFQKLSLRRWHELVIWLIEGEVRGEGGRESVINVVQNITNLLLMNCNPTDETKEETPAPAQCLIPKDSTLINVVVAINQCGLAAVPSRGHG